MALDPEQLIALEEYLANRDERLIGRFEQKLDQRRSISEAQHKMHHDYIQTIVDRQKRRQEIWDGVQKSVIGSIVLGLVGSLGYAVIKLLEMWRDGKGGH